MTTIYHEGETMKERTISPWIEEAPPLLTVEDVAWLLQVHKNTVYNWIHSGKLYAFKVGRDWRIPKEQIPNA